MDPRKNALDIANSEPSKSAHFRFLRDMTGYTQKELADALGVSVLTVKRWERTDYQTDPPEYALSFLQSARALQVDVVGCALDAVWSTNAKVKLPYYRTQKEFRERHKEGFYGCANANTRLIASVLDREEIPYEIV